MVSHPSSRRCHPPRAFRPCRSSRLRRFSPCETLQVYCALQPTMRFAAFPTCFWTSAAVRLRAVRSIPGLPQRRAHTLQSFSLVVRRTASPRPLPSCRCESLRSTSRPFSSDESVVMRWRCRQPQPDALLGLSPLQGSPPSISLRSTISASD